MDYSYKARRGRGGYQRRGRYRYKHNNDYYRHWEYAERDKRQYKEESKKEVNSDKDSEPQKDKAMSKREKKKPATFIIDTNFSWNSPIELEPMINTSTKEELPNITTANTQPIIDNEEVVKESCEEVKEDNEIVCDNEEQSNTQETAATEEVKSEAKQEEKIPEKPTKKKVNFVASATPAFGWYVNPDGNPSESIPYYPSQPSQPSLPKPTISYVDDPITELNLSQLSISFDPQDRAKKGFINTHVSCYANVVFQALLACTPFYNLLNQLANQIEPQPENAKPSSSFLKCFTEMYRYFCVENQNKRGSYGTSIIKGEIIFKQIISKFDSTVQQQDSQEFLFYLLDGMHKELLTIQAKDGQDEEEVKSDDEWMEMGEKKVIKYNNAETGNIEKSLISDIFGGIFKSELNVQGKVHSTATYEPFYLLSLDISKTDTISKAMKLFFQEEELSDYVDEVKKVKVRAHYKQLIERLPNILVVHLKRFIYSKTIKAIHKLQTPVHFLIIL